VTQRFVVVVAAAPTPPARSAYRVFGSLGGAIDLRFSADAGQRTVAVAVDRGMLASLHAAFGFSTTAGNGRVAVSLVRQTHDVRGHPVAGYAGRLVLSAPGLTGAVVLSDFRAVSVHATSVHLDAFGTVTKREGAREVRHPVSIALSIVSGRERNPRP
jgi:hypothetical protein